MVRVTGLEPAHLTASEPKSDVSANFTTPAKSCDSAEETAESQHLYRYLFSWTGADGLAGAFTGALGAACGAAAFTDALGAA